MANMPTLTELEKQIVELHKKLHSTHDTYIKADSVYQDVCQQSSNLIAEIRRDTNTDDSVSTDKLMTLHPKYETQIKASLGMLEYCRGEADLHKEATHIALTDLKMTLGLWNIARNTEEGRQQTVRDIHAYRISKRYSIANQRST